MKSSLLFLCIIAITIPVYAQEETLTGDIHKTGSYGGPAVKFASVGGSFGVFAGGFGGVVYNKKWVVGGGGFGLTNRTEEYGIGYGGGIIEYILNSDKLTHLSCGFLIGGGGVEKKGPPWTGSQSVFVFEPGINLNMNINTGLRIGNGASNLLLTG